MTRRVPTATSRGGPLVGRRGESDELVAVFEATEAGRGGLVLVAGDAGVGKTRLVGELLAASRLLRVDGPSTQGTTPPYHPIVAAFRAYLRRVPGGLADCGPLTGHLALLLPELGPAPGSVERPTLFEAIRCALVTMGRAEPIGVFLDDLQWADETTLELLAALASAIEREPVLVIGAYRSDDIPRGHALRRLRSELRRSGTLRELQLTSLDVKETTELVAALVGEEPSRTLATTIHLRTEGIPFFIEELVYALRVQERIQSGPRGLELAGGD